MLDVTILHTCLCSTKECCDKSDTQGGCRENLESMASVIITGVHRHTGVHFISVSGAHRLCKDGGTSRGAECLHSSHSCSERITNPSPFRRPPLPVAYLLCLSAATALSQSRATENKTVVGYTCFLGSSLGGRICGRVCWRK